MRASRLTPWLAGLALVVPALSRAASPDPAISANVATLFVGEEKIVEGTVTAAEREGGVVHLRFGTAPQSLTVSLVIGLLSDFPADPERYYLGKTVRVAGTVRSFKDQPEIVVHDPANIRVVGATSSGSDRVMTAPPAGDEARGLREQVKTLNERVRTLEGEVEKLRNSGE